MKQSLYIQNTRSSSPQNKLSRLHSACSTTGALYRSILYLIPCELYLMKQIIIMLVVGLISAGTTLGTYKYYFEQPPSPVRDVIIREPSLAKQIGHPNYPDITEVTSFKDAADLVRPTVVHIHSSSGDRYERMFGGEASGSGVVVSEDGYIVTNNHVISGAREVTVTLNNKRTYEATIIGTDKTTDLAVIKI